MDIEGIENRKSFSTYIVYTIVTLALSTGFLSLVNSNNDHGQRIVRIEEKISGLSDRYTGSDATRDQRLVELRLQNIERRLDEIEKN